jgi:GT2 family glycosyltransferase
MKPIASIIIPIRNNLHFTAKCLESIASSPPKTAYEIIVVDNASDDGTREFLEEKDNAGELQYIRNDSPKPFAASCNRGAEAAAGKFLVFLNNDIEAFPGWLDALVEVAERSDRIGVVGAKLLFPDGTIQHAGVAFHYFKRLRQYGPYHIFRKFPRYAPAVNKEREFKCVTGACLLSPKKVFMESGGFDERFINCFEDVSQR